MYNLILKLSLRLKSISVKVLYIVHIIICTSRYIVYLDTYVSENNAIISHDRVAPIAGGASKSKYLLGANTKYSWTKVHEVSESRTYHQPEGCIIPLGAQDTEVKLGTLKALYVYVWCGTYTGPERVGFKPIHT